MRRWIRNPLFGTRLRLCVVLAGLLVGAWVVAAEKGAEEEFRTAESFYKEKTYRRALEHYDRCVEAAPKGKLAAEAGWKGVLCRVRLGEWDPALEAANAYTLRWKDTYWEMRGHIVTGEIFRGRPHHGYILDGKFQYDWAQNAQWTNRETEDSRACLTSFEAAKAVSYRFLWNKTGLPEGIARKESTQEIAGLNFDLAKAIEATTGYPPIERASWTPPEKYDSDEIPFDRHAFLMLEVSRIDPSDTKYLAARALRDQAYYALRYRMNQPFSDDRARLETEDPIGLFEKALTDYPKASDADEIRFALGLTLQSRLRFLDALATFQAVVDKHPKSNWVSDAKAHMQEIRRHRLNIEAPAATLPGKKPELVVTTRNVGQVHFRAYEADLKSLFTSGRYSRHYDESMTDLGPFLAAGSSRNRYVGDMVAEWDLAPDDKGEHQFHVDKVAVPLVERGAYLIEAGAGKLTFWVPLLITDLTVVQMMDRSGIELFVADAVSGDPVEGASVLVRQRWSQYSRLLQRSVWQGLVERGETDADGGWAVEHNRNGEERNRNHQTVAWLGDRLAFSEEGYFYYGRYGSDEGIRVFAHTDRPVYRPEHTVHFRGFLRRKTTEGYRNLPGTKVRLVVMDAKRQEIYNQAMTTDEHGGVVGELKLGVEPPLGMYHVSFQAPGPRDWQQVGACSFRVEEYNLPELLVEVLPPTERIRAGGKVTFRIQGRYYFGAPAVGASVTYRVMRRSYAPAAPFHEDYEWFYPSYNYGHDEGEFVADGTGTTDDEGILEVEVDTAPAKASYPDEDHEYTVHVDMVDASRRTIEGQGAVRVTRQEYAAFVRSRRSFYGPGDHAEFEIRAVDANGAAVPAEGTLEVARTVPEGRDEAGRIQWKATAVVEEPMKLDEVGRAFYRWQPDERGRFRVRFLAKDSWGEEVIGEVVVWVVDPRYAGQEYRFREVQVLTDKRTYREGETARVMIASDRPDACVLLRRNLGDRLPIDSGLLRLDGRTVVVEIPIEKRHVPNFFLDAVVVRNGEVALDRTELFVPPVNEFLQVKVSPDRSEYEPGRPARYEVTTTDVDGKPISAVVSLSVVDRSIFYIQPDMTPDIRTFFYGGRRSASGSIVSSEGLTPTTFFRDETSYETYRMHGTPPGWPGGWRGGRGDFDGQAGGFDTAGGAFGYAGAEFEEARNDLGEARLRKGLAQEAPGAAASPEPHSRGRLKEEKSKGRPSGGDGGSRPPEMTVRTNFAETAAWRPTLLTDAKGHGVFEFTFPDSLTSWRTSAHAIGDDTRVGTATHEVVTKKRLLVRLQAPRFFRERDEVVLSGIVHQTLGHEAKVAVALELGGETIEPIGDLQTTVVVADGGEQRVDWRVRVVRPGEARVRISVWVEETTDAMEMSFPVLVHGMEKYIGWAGATTDEGTSKLVFEVPEPRDPARSRLEVVLSPGILPAVMEALPYLVEYPYGCVEQTLNRFLPAVAVAHALREAHLTLDDVADLRGRLDTGHGVGRQPDWMSGKPSAMLRQADLDRALRLGLKRLGEFQGSDGGWGWWRYDGGSPYMTALVTAGLLEARDAGVLIDDGWLLRAGAFLDRAAGDVDLSSNERIWVHHARALLGKAQAGDLDISYEKREELSQFGHALLARTLARLGDTQRAAVVIRNMEDFIEVDAEHGMAHWGRARTGWWYWYNDDVETNAAALMALLEADPKNKHLPMVARWLLANRQGMRWKSTRDSGAAVRALCAYARSTGELDPDYVLTVELDGKAVRSVRVTRENLFGFDDRFSVVGEELTGGEHTLTVSREGRGACYYAAALTYFTKEEDVGPGGSEIELRRTYTKLTPRRIYETVQGKKVARLRYDRELLKSGTVLRSGDLVEVKIELETPVAYEYLIIEDPKAAGCEAVDVRSGYAYGSLCSNMELRDERTVFFVSYLPAGKRDVTYRLRAEIPGTFHAMPAQAWAMYAPRVRANASEFRVGIEDAE